MDAVTAAFSGFFDYAGLFPPAGLSLDAVVERYGAYRSGPDAWMLGRLIVPGERIAEADATAARRGASPDDPWPISVLVGDADRADAMGARLLADAGQSRHVTVAAIEAAAATPDEVARLARLWPDSLERYVEIPAGGDPGPLLRALADHGMLGKIRAGGVTPDRIPPTIHVARFLARARECGVAVKATAGLHHAIRGDYRLTYQEGSDTAVMHGFVNLLLAATLLAAGKIDEDLADSCLDDDRPEVFKLSGRAGSWLNGVVTYGEISQARNALLRSVGSCSFEEPVAEIDALDFGLRGVDGL